MARNTVSIHGYIPAQLYTGKDWYVGYYVQHPETGQLVRKRVKVNRIKNKKERKRYGLRLVHEINQKLYMGWNPFTHQEAPRSMTRLLEKLDSFLEVKKKTQRPGGFRSYKSQANALREFLVQRNRHEILISSFDRKLAADLMTFVAKKKRDLNPTTYNNYLRFFKVFWNWLIEFEYSSANPFDGIRSRRKIEKERLDVPPGVRKIITRYFEREDPNFLIVCYLIFYTLVRETEICNLKVADVRLDTQTIMIRPDVAKTGKSRISTIPDVFLEVLGRYIEGADPGDYLVGEGMRPGKLQTTDRRLRYRWNKMRDATGISDRYKLYSLRDSGIIQKLQDGVSPEEVMKQADHSSLQITTIYARHVRPEGSHQIKKRSSSF